MSQKGGDLSFIEVQCKTIYSNFLAITINLDQVLDGNTKAQMHRLFLLADWKKTEQSRDMTGFNSNCVGGLTKITFPQVCRDPRRNKLYGEQTTFLPQGQKPSTEVVLQLLSLYWAHLGVGDLQCHQGWQKWEKFSTPWGWSTTCTQAGKVPWVYLDTPTWSAYSNCDNKGMTNFTLAMPILLFLDSPFK